MKLPVSFLEKKEKPEYFLALVLRNEKATSVIFEKSGSTIKYISSDEEYFKNTIEDAGDEEFLEVLDKVISNAENSLPENIETHKTLYGLKESWILEGKIKKEYLEKLKKAGSELSLDPIGFLVFSESIINLIQKDEGAPITAVLADIGKKYITVSLVKNGRILETKSSEIHQSATYTVDTLLKHFQSPEVMPSRIIILDSEEDELTQEFINHSWSKSLPFLHLPQILSLEKDASVKAMLLGAATQMEARLLYSSALNLEDEEPTKTESNENTNKEVIGENEPVDRNENLDRKEGEQTPDYKGEESMEYFGFVENSDVTKTAPLKSVDYKISDNLREQKIQDAPEEVKLEQEEKMGLSAIVTQVTSKIKDFSPKLINSLKKIKLKEVFSYVLALDKKILAVGGGFLLLLIIFAFFWFFSAKATVNIFLDAKEDSKSTSVTFSPSSTTDIANSIIAAEKVSVDEQGSVTGNATGGKDVGTEAKGSVTVFNNASSSVNFPAGTTITSTNGLKFTFDSSVSVASASGDIFSGTKPGTSTVNVTATAIGQEYNLPSGTKFSIGGNPDAAAKNDNALSGGTKKSITIVSEDDLAKLLKQLPKNLEGKARNDIKDKVDSDKLILSTFTDETVSSESFNKKEGDETKELTLKGTVTFETVSFSNSDIEKIANTLFDSDQNQIRANSLTVEAKNIGIEKNEDITADITIKAKTFPRIDTKELASQIKGFEQLKAINMISNLSQVDRVKIDVSPNLPFFPKNLPTDSNKIKININSN